MGPFGKFTNKLKSQQKEASKNVSEDTDFTPKSPRENACVLTDASQAARKAAGADCSNRHHVEGLHDNARQPTGVYESAQAGRRTDLSLPVRVTKKLHANSIAIKNEMSSMNFDQRELEDVKGKGNSKERKCKPNSEQREYEVNISCKESICNHNVENLKETFSSQGKVSVTEDDGKEAKNPSLEGKNEAVALESSDLDSSSLSLSLGLNRIRTRSGPLHSEEEHKVTVSERKTTKSDKSIPISERTSHRRSHHENVMQKQRDDSGRLELGHVSSNKEGESYRTHAAAAAIANISTICSEGKMRRKIKAESHRLQRFHSGRSPPDQNTLTKNEIFATTGFSISEANEKASPQALSAQPTQKVPPKSEFILEKQVPSSLLSCLNNGFDEAFDTEVNGKQLDVIKEADSPTFHHPIPQVAHKRVFKKWPKDFKSFSHELGPRGGRPHDVQRPHSDNDLEELLAALRARFNTAKEEVDSELKYFASDLIEILDRNTDSFPEWKENVEDLLLLAQRCAKLSPVDFRRECEKIVHELDERRQELPMGLLKQLHTRMLFILTRCTRLLQFQKETIPEEEGLHKVHQFLKGVPSVALSSGSAKRVKSTGTSKNLLSEVLEQSARNDAGVPKVKPTRKHRLAGEKARFKDEQPSSPNILNLRKSVTAVNEIFDLIDTTNSSATKVHNECIVNQEESTWDQTGGKLGDADLQLRQSEKAPSSPLGDLDKDEPELVLCRICEEQVLTSQLQPHSLPCSLADAYDAQGNNIDERLRMLADGLEKIADSNIKSNHMVVDESPDVSRLFKSNSHEGSDNASPQFSDLKVADIRLDDTCISESGSVEDLRGLSLINFKRLLGKTDQGFASSSAGSGTPRSTLTTPRTSQLDLLWAERNSFAEQEDISQIYELAAIAREIASKNPMEEGVLLSLVSWSEELHELLSRNKIPAFTLNTFGRRIEKLLKEKTFLFGGAVDARRTDSFSGSFDDDGMSTDDGVQSLRSTPTHPSCSDRITIEDFYILKPISRGAFGRVFLAKKRSTGDLFAIKVLRKIDMIRKNAVENILAERDILITVCNPFVVRFFYSFTCRDNLYLVMEYLNGGDLYSLLRHLGCLEEDVARVYIAELVLALEYLHSLGVVHRDLKPDNILIAHDGHIKLTDFGLSKVGLINSTDDLSGPTNGIAMMQESMFDNCTEPVIPRECRKERSAVGTPDYLAPEILLGTEHGNTADWWSVGVILFECITGLPPFNAEHPQIIFDNILNRKIPWPNIPDEMSYDAKDLIERLLTEDPNQRLGAKGAAEVKSHPFFKDISWDNLARQKAAFVPSPESIDDTSYFTSRHLESYATSSPRFGDSSDCETSCSSSNSMKVMLNEGEDDYGDLADFQRSPSVERTFNNFSFKNASQLAYMNYDILSQSGRDSAKGPHSRNQSIS